MAAATTDRKPVTIQITVGNAGTYGVAAGEKLIRGCLVVVDGDGLAYDATATTGVNCVGYAESTVDNTNGQDGDVKVNVVGGVAILLENVDAPNAVTAIKEGKLVYIKDNQTVTTDATGTVPAGVLHRMDPDTGKPFVHVGSTAYHGA